MPTITKELICESNRQLLDGTEHEENAIPGQVRDHSVVVGNYKGPPAEDCEFLLDCLAEWLEGDLFRFDDPETGFALSVVCAAYAHLHIAWLNPFGDGNGRTARLLEFLILARSGLAPLPAAHLLSNHCNQTRDRYYRELSAASRSSSTVSFVTCAIEGFVDGLREQISEVRRLQLEFTWINYVHDTMNRSPSSAARDRQRALVLAVPAGEALVKSELPLLTPALAAMYATKGPRTLSRDLNRLQDEGLIHRHHGQWMANHFVIEAYLPPLADNDRRS